MSKSEESTDREIDKSIQLGMENVEILKQAKSWCKHFRGEMKSFGYLAQMLELPIGSIEISCQHSERPLESMNLPWIVPMFIIENCVGCIHHESNGDLSWGEQIIENNRRQIQEHHQNEQIRQKQLMDISERIQELSHQAKETVKFDERGILTYIEKLFLGSEEKQEEAVKLLVQAARIGSDLFSEVAINILIEQSLSKEFASKCLPICIELARQREDLSSRLNRMALTTIEASIYPEQASEVLIHLGKTVEYPLANFLIENLIDNQNHDFRLYLSGNKPLYPNSTKVLNHSYEANPLSIIEALISRLRCNDKDTRINVCGAIKLLQTDSPQIGLDLLPELVESLGLDDDQYGVSADGEAKECIARALSYKPLRVDEYLISAISQKRPAVQKEIIDIYHVAVKRLGKEDSKDPHKPSQIRIEAQISANRCLEFIKDESIEIDVRYQASECLKSISYWCPEAVILNFEVLLGYYALICVLDEPLHLSPQIILIGQKSEDPQITALKREKNHQNWRFLRGNLFQTIEELAQHNPKAIGEIVIPCYNNLDTKNNEKFKSALLNLLGNLGEEYSLQPQILPLLMNGLTDFESQLNRAFAIQAVEKMYQYSSSVPPKDVIDILIVHLRDPYTIVHKAAIRICHSYVRWFNQEQALEAFNQMIGWMYTYKKNPLELDNIIKTILQISCRSTNLKNIGIHLIISVLPPNEIVINHEGIVVDMIRCVDPSEETAIIVTRQIGWCLSNHDRDRYNSYEGSYRSQMFEWLHKVPKDIYKSIKLDLFESAKQLAEKDILEACYFASIFAKYDDFAEEKEILRIALSSLKQEKRYSKSQADLKMLKIMATSNSYLQNGNLNKAYSTLLEIEEN